MFPRTLLLLAATSLLGCESLARLDDGSNGDSLGLPLRGDTCSMAIPLTRGVPVTATTVGAMRDFPCTSGPDVAFSFTAQSTGAFQARVAPVPDGGYSMGLPSAVLIGDSCDAGLCRSSYGFVNFRANAGQTTILAAAESYDSASSFQFSVEAITPPGNDTCANPAPLTLGVPAEVALSTAIDDIGGSCGWSNNDVVFSFTPRTTGRYLFSSAGSMALSTTCGQSCTSPKSYRLTADLTAGVTAFIVVEGTSSGTIVVNEVVVPVNDQCLNALALTEGRPVVGTTVGATRDFGCSSGVDVAFSFTPTHAGAFQARVAAAPDAGYAMSLPSAMVIGDSCDAGLCRSSYGGVNFRANAGQTLILAATESYDSPASFQFVVNAITPPGNDTCAAPAPLTLGQPAEVNLATALDDITGSCGWSNNDVVFSFTPRTSGRYVFSSSFSMALSFTCGQGCTSSRQYRLTADLAAGVTAFIVVEGSSSGALVVNEVAVPVNDQCIKALPLIEGRPVVSTTLGATREFICSSGADVAFSFTPTHTGAFQARVEPVPDAGYAMGLPGAMYLGDSCDAGLCNAWNGFVNFRAKAGETTLLAAADSYDYGAGFQFVVNAITPPGNDTCATPAPLTLGQPAEVNLATALDDIVGGCGWWNNDVVYSFTPLSTGRYVFTSSFAMALSTTCGQGCSYPKHYRLTADLTAGVTAFVVVEGTSSGSITVTKVTVDDETDAGTPSGPVDLAIIGMNTDAPDSLSVVFFSEVRSGTVLKLTDNRWAGSALLATEQTATFTTTQTVSAGTVVTFSFDGSTGVATPAVGTFVGSLNALSSSGDQVLVYQPGPSPSFVFAISAAKLDGFNSSADSNDTQVPTGLIEGVTAIDLGQLMRNADDNVEYIGSRTGTRAQLKAALFEASNWRTNNTTPFTFSTTNFTIIGP